MGVKRSISPDNLLSSGRLWLGGRMSTPTSCRRSPHDTRWRWSVRCRTATC